MEELVTRTWGSTNHQQSSDIEVIQMELIDSKQAEVDLAERILDLEQEVDMLGPLEHVAEHMHISFVMLVVVQPFLHAF